jgi:hypothetical protein
MDPKARTESGSIIRITDPDPGGQLITDLASGIRIRNTANMIFVK